MKQNIVPPKKIEAKETFTASSIKTSSAESLPFGKKNYTLMLIGVAMILGGFFIMTLDKEEFGFGFLGITLGPAISFVGFMFQFYAILKRK
jgi:hypothetical protein